MQDKLAIIRRIEYIIDISDNIKDNFMEKKIVYEKAQKVMKQVAEYMRENKCHPARAWDFIKNASHLTEEQMKQCALVAFMGYKIIK